MEEVIKEAHKFFRFVRRHYNVVNSTEPKLHMDRSYVEYQNRYPDRNEYFYHEETSNFKFHSYIILNDWLHNDYSIRDEYIYLITKDTKIRDLYGDRSYTPYRTLYRIEESLNKILRKTKFSVEVKEEFRNEFLNVTHLNSLINWLTVYPDGQYIIVNNIPNFINLYFNGDSDDREN